MGMTVRGAAWAWGMSAAMGLGGLAGVVGATERAAAEPAKTEPAPSEPSKAPAPARTEGEPKAEENKEQLVYVSLKTSKGEIVLELNQTKAPVSVANFLQYVEQGHYNGTVFHRVIRGFMIQGGGFDRDMNQRPTGAGIVNEWRNGLKNTRGTIAMARTSDPNSATAQFFINTVDNAFLSEPRDGAGYAVFGRVVSGMDVVDAIANVRTGVRRGMPDVPVEAVTIDTATKLSDEDAAKFAEKKD